MQVRHIQSRLSVESDACATASLRSCEHKKFRVQKRGAGIKRGLQRAHALGGEAKAKSASAALWLTNRNSETAELSNARTSCWRMLLCFPTPFLDFLTHTSSHKVGSLHTCVKAATAALRPPTATSETAHAQPHPPLYSQLSRTSAANVHSQPISVPTKLRAPDKACPHANLLQSYFYLQLSLSQPAWSDDNPTQPSSSEPCMLCCADNQAWRSRGSSSRRSKFIHMSATHILTGMMSPPTEHSFSSRPFRDSILILTPIHMLRPPMNLSPLPQDDGPSSRPVAQSDLEARPNRSIPRHFQSRPDTASTTASFSSASAELPSQPSGLTPSGSRRNFTKEPASIPHWS